MVVETSFGPWLWFFSHSSGCYIRSCASFNFLCVQDLAFASYIESEAVTAMDQHSSMALISWSWVVTAPLLPFLAVLHGLWDLSSPTRDRTQGPWQSKCQVLTTEPPGSPPGAAPLDEVCTLQFPLIPITPYYFIDAVPGSVQFSCSVVSHCLWPHEPQHARPPCPSPTLGVYPNSCPLSQWCHPTISSSVVPFSSCLQSFPTSWSFQMSQLFASGGQNFGVSASTSVFPVNCYC